MDHGGAGEGWVFFKEGGGGEGGLGVGRDLPHPGLEDRNKGKGREGGWGGGWGGGREWAGAERGGGVAWLVWAGGKCWGY